jgi:ABC-type multidrug transport system permease subunit
MPHDGLKDSTLVSALRDLFADLADLLQKEIRLARAEMTAAVSKTVQGAAWMAAAGVLALIAFLFLLEAIVFGMASLGLALHWAALIVAVLLAAGAAGAFFYGRTMTQGSLKPERTVRQVQSDVSVVREQISS